MIGKLFSAGANATINVPSAIMKEKSKTHLHQKLGKRKEYRKNKMK